MADPCVSVERKGGVVTATLSNPPHHTLTAQGVGELAGLLDSLEGDRDLRALVFTGGGDGVFVAHYEVGELAASAESHVTGSGESGRAPGGLHPFHRVLLRLEALPAITIAAINGNAAGGGFELALACDFRLMAAGPFRCGLPETSVGIIPGAGGTQRFARLLGTAKALDLILHAELLTPEEALELGLVHRVFEQERFAAETRAFARDIASRSPLALAQAKRAIREGAPLTLEQGLAVEQEAFERTMRSKDAAGAMRAWLAGKPYDWKGE